MARRIGMHLRRRVAGVALAAVVLVLARAAAAQETHDVAPIRALLDDARYEDAIAAAHRYLGQPALSARDTDSALELLATAQLAIRDERGATQTLATLYGRDPGHVLSDPDPSPVVQAAFARARTAAHPAPNVRLSLVDDASRPASTVLVRVDAGADTVDELRVSYRTRGETAFEQAVMAVGADGVARARIPRDESIALEYVVEYYVQAFAPSQTRLAAVGSAESPLTLTVPARAAATTLTVDAHAAGTEHHGGSVLDEWWFWTIVGAVVVGAGVTLFVVFGPPSQGPSDGTLGGGMLH